MFLVDTSVFVNYLKGRDTKATQILDQATDQDFYVTPIVFQEILQGAKDVGEYETLTTYLGSQSFCHPVDPVETYARAARIYFDCRRKGLTIRSTVDCLIAQIALDNSLPLLSDDDDFKKIAKVRKLTLLP